jgi:hypothetical protein
MSAGCLIANPANPVAIGVRIEAVVGKIIARMPAAAAAANVPNLAQFIDEFLLV